MSSDKATYPTDVYGGSVGDTKFQFNYIHAMLDRTAGPNAGGSNADIFAMRA